MIGLYSKGFTKALLKSNDYEEMIEMEK